MGFSEKSRTVVERWKRKLGGNLGRNQDSANANIDNAIGS